MGSFATNDDIRVTLSTKLEPIPKPGTAEYLALSHTDHIVVVNWTSKEGWGTPKLEPFADLKISPTASCLHYATECFEGLKAYRGYDGKLRLFRPDCNGERLAVSAKRASLPVYPPEQLKNLVSKLMEIDGPRWLPKDCPGQYLYIRPALIGTGRRLGYKIPDEAMLFIVATPYPSLSSMGRGLRLLTSPPDSIRAWPGGFGYAKLGANYGPSLEAHSNATGKGFDQILWLFGSDRLVTEAGASNFFAVVKSKTSDQLELLTPSLQNSLILSGITRRSVVELARSRLTKPAGGVDALQVIERDVTISEIHDAWKEGRLVEAFVVGTAYFVAPVEKISDDGVDMEITYASKGKTSYANLIKSWLEGITYGEEDHEWSHIVQESGLE